MISKIIVVGSQKDFQLIKQAIEQAGIDALIVKHDDHRLDALPYLIAPHTQTLHEEARKMCQPHPTIVVRNEIPDLRKLGWPTQMKSHLDDGDRFIISKEKLELIKFETPSQPNRKKRRAKARPKRI